MQPGRIGSMMLDREYQIHVDETPDGLVLEVTKGKVSWNLSDDAPDTLSTDPLEIVATIPLTDRDREALIGFLGPTRLEREEKGGRKPESGLPEFESSGRRKRGG